MEHSTDFPPTPASSVTHSQTHWWIAHFATELMALDPEMPMGFAIQSAVDSFHEARDVEPEAAAELYALVHL